MEEFSKINLEKEMKFVEMKKLCIHQRETRKHATKNAQKNKKELKKKYK